MATGVSQSSNSEKAISAMLNKRYPYLIPKREKVSLSYHSKIIESEILKPIYSEYVVFKETKEVIDKISLNDIVFSDNLFAIHSLINQGLKVDLIYLDPPYNTGFDFLSKDANHAYSDSFDLSEYIEFMRIRLILLREVLTDSGSIYVHIGHQMLPYLKVIMDEVFGIRNCRNIITRKKCSSKNYTRNQFPNLNDFILFYSKSNNFIWNPQGIDPSEEWIKKEYPKVDERGQYKLVPIHAPGVRNGETGKEWKGLLPPKGKHWQYTPEKLDELDRNGEIHWSKTGNPRRKVYLTKDKKIPLGDYWGDFRDAHHQSIKITGYPTEKNLAMLEMIVRSSSHIGSIVLDPFCGSGTTLVAARNQQRYFIGIDQSLNAIKHCIQRLNEDKNLLNDSSRLICDKDVFNHFEDEIYQSLR